jgi:methyl-accepting chemotaxis protein
MSRHSIRQRLMFLLLMPLASLLYLAGVQLSDRHGQVQELERLTRLVEVAVRAGELLHHAQRERGLSAGFLGSRGEAGFRNRLLAERRETDLAMARFQPTAEGLGAGLDGRVAEVRRALAELESRRTGVDRLAVTAAEAVAYYTDTNGRLLALVAAITRESTVLEVLNRGAAYVSYMRAKEAAGIERAVLSNTFAAGRFAPGMYARLLGLVALQDEHLASFQAYGGADAWQRHQQAMAGSFAEVTQKFRQAALASGGGEIAGMDAKLWFARQTEKIDAMAGVETRLAEELTAQADLRASSARRGFLLALLGVAAVVLLTAGLAAMVVRSIVRPLGRAVEVLGAMAEGDLTQRLDINGRDEVARMGESLDCAIEAIHGALGDVRTASHSMAEAAGQLSSVSDDLASGAQQQASSLEQTASTLEQITATVRQNAANAIHANELAKRSQEVAVSGGQVVSDAVRAMRDINESSKRISDIIAAIDEIAFQTNLLALNAAVEAARAGEHGRGFAVVATEVRELAHRTSRAAKEVKTLIADTSGKVEIGTALVNRSGAMLEEIVASVKRATQIVGEIASASKEQSSGIEQVNKAVSQMDRVTQAGAARNQELSGTAASMAHQAQALRVMLARFQLQGHPVDDQALAPPAASSRRPRRPLTPARRSAPHPRSPTIPTLHIDPPGPSAVEDEVN